MSVTPSARQYYLQHPEQRQVIHDRVDQALAELSLSRLEHQWPVEAVVTFPAPNEFAMTSLPPTYPPPEDNGRQGTVVSVQRPTGMVSIQPQQPQSLQGGTAKPNLYTMGQLVAQQINDIIQQLTMERAFPQLRVQSGYLTGYSSDRPEQLDAMNVQAGLTTDILHITKQVSSGTAQGTVYGVQVLPNAALHYVDIFDTEMNMQRRVPAVLKKSPIYDPLVWKKYVALTQLDRLQQEYNALTPQQQFEQGTFIESRALLILKQADLPRNMQWQYAAFAVAAQGIYDKYLSQAFNMINNAAYVDAVVTLVGSKMVEANLSPFFPLLYGTFRALDRKFFDDYTEQLLGPDVQNIPVQIIIEEKLDGSIKELLVDSGWMLVGEKQAAEQLRKKDPVVLDADRTMSVLAQIVFGLAGAQKYFGFVHNDLHWQNVMFKNVDANTVLYYEHNGVYYRVPTFGKWMRLIDFGRSRINVQGIDLYSAETIQVDPRWNVSSFNNDLMRIVSVLLLTLLPGTYSIRGHDINKANALLDFLSHVIQCGARDNRGIDTSSSLFDQVNACVDAQPNQESECWREEFSVGPFTTKSTCRNAIPIENIQYFGSLRIDPALIPADAIVYPF